MYAPDEELTNELMAGMTRPNTPAPMVNYAGKFWDLTVPKRATKNSPAAPDRGPRTATTAIYHTMEGPADNSRPGSSWDLTTQKGTAKSFAVMSGPELQAAIAAAYHVIAEPRPPNDEQRQNSK